MKLTVLFLLLSVSLCRAQGELFFVNPSGHKSQVRDVALSNDKKYVITGSFDKTIKKWDIETGEVVKEYRSKIGPGFEGAVYSIELSPDNRYLAAGGWFGPEDESEDLGDIRIFDYETGEVTRVLKGLGSPPKNIDISPDSKYVIAGDGYSKILKWDVTTGQKVGVFDYHKFETGKLLITHEARAGRMMSVDQEGTICFWDINNTAKPLKIDKKTVPGLMKKSMKGLANEVADLAISPTLEDYAFSLENLIVIYDQKYKAYAFIPNETRPGFLRFSADGLRLLTGCVDRGSIMHAKVYEKNGKDWLQIADFDAADGSMICGEFIDNNTYVTPGGESNQVYIWSLEKESSGKQKLLKNFSSNGFLPYAAGLNNGVIAFADVWTENMGKSEFNKEFDLFLKAIEPYSQRAYTRPIFNKDNYSINWCRTYNGAEGIQAGLEIKQGVRVLDTIKRDEYNGDRHTAYTFTNDNFIVTGGDYGFLEAYDVNGEVYNRFVGHTDYIESVEISTDKRRLISSSSDNTIRIWNIENLGKYEENQAKMSVYEYMKTEQSVKYPILFETLEKKIKELGLEKPYNEKSIKAWETIIKEIDKTNIGEYYHDMLSYMLNEYRTVFIYPIVSIFMTKEGEWIIWDEKGYFSASKKGAQYVGYYMNQGKDNTARFYPFEQFDLKYNRPDIILEELGLGSEKIRNFYYKAYLKRLEKMGITEKQMKGEIHLPEVAIKSQTLSADKKSVDIAFTASDAKYRLDRINVFINDVPVYGRAGIKVNKAGSYEQTIHLDLAEGRNKVQISALNDQGAESLKESFVLFTNKSDKKPDLYLITIGTSIYKDKRFNLKYAAKDAQDMVETFKHDPAYNQVFHEILLDEKSTKENIEQLKAFLQRSTRNDVVMVFIAGHGLLDENLDYYYATYDIDFNQPAMKGMLFSEIEELLDGIGALKKLLFMDTCHSGEVDKSEMEKESKVVKKEEDVEFRTAGQGVRKKEGEGLGNTSELVKELFSDLRRGTGSTVISSAGGAEYAMESSTWKNGLFTYCLLSGLSSQKADLNLDGKIMLSEVQQYVRSEVSRLSQGKQQPTSRLENLSLDYPIWIK
ncbi:MAG: hypothetical protein K0R65_778 [Crocinitomicaceae bacterium]|jgi:WD40 repeat protein/uncharacterized caspase-like protein|nr:hypothetical protein [Crocinitomicaceae bacterium]